MPTLEAWTVARQMRSELDRVGLDLQDANATRLCHAQCLTLPLLTVPYDWCIYGG